MSLARGVGAPVGQIDDLALIGALDGGMRLVDKAFQTFGQPVIATRHLAVAVHALLHHHPVAVIGDDEAMQIEIEAVLNGGAVHLGDEPADIRQACSVEADALADRRQAHAGFCANARRGRRRRECRVRRRAASSRVSRRRRRWS